MTDKRYVGEFREQAVRGMNEEFTATRSMTSLAKLVREQEAAAHQTHRKLSAEGLARQADFARDHVILGDHIASASAALRSRWSHVHEAAPAESATLHVFGPDTGAPGAPSPYTLPWTMIEGGTGGAGIEASANVHDGTFSASQYTIGGQLNAYAGLGVFYVPTLNLSTLVINPFVNWNGYDILTTRVYDPQLNPQAWGVASAQIGLILQSWDLAGNGFRTDTTLWTDLWNRSEINPSGTRNYGGSVGLGTVTLRWLVTNQRQYAIWVACRALVISQSVFDLEILASASVSCQLPVLFVDEQA